MTAYTVLNRASHDKKTIDLCVRACMPNEVECFLTHKHKTQAHLIETIKTLQVTITDF